MTKALQANVIYHANCPDGWTGAWLMHKYLNRNYKDVNLYGASYGTEPPLVSGDVFLVDFCYEPEYLRTLEERADTLTILDHHQTALEWVTEVWGDAVQTTWDRSQVRVKDIVVLDQDHSGAMLAMLWTGERAAFVKYLQDRDLWKFKLPDTPAVFAALTSYEYTLENWDTIAAKSIESLVAEGRAVQRYREILITDTLKNAYQANVLGYEDIWVVACPHAIGSDVAGELAKRDPGRFGAYYVDLPNNTRRWGLRSTDHGADVATIAALVGGGGHTHASGFELPR